MTTLFCEEPKIQKITINNQNGYFINHAYYQEILRMDNECLSLRAQIIILEQNNLMLQGLNDQMKIQIDSYLKQNKQLLTKNNLLLASGITNIVLLLGCLAEGLIIYNAYK